MLAGLSFSLKEGNHVPKQKMKRRSSFAPTQQPDPLASRLLLKINENKEALLLITSSFIPQKQGKEDRSRLKTGFRRRVVSKLETLISVPSENKYPRSRCDELISEMHGRHRRKSACSFSLGRDATTQVRNDGQGGEERTSEQTDGLETLYHILLTTHEVICSRLQLSRKKEGGSNLGSAKQTSARRFSR